MSSYANEQNLKHLWQHNTEREAEREVANSYV